MIEVIYRVIDYINGTDYWFCSLACGEMYDFAMDGADPGGIEDATDEFKEEAMEDGRGCDFCGQTLIKYEEEK